MPVTVAAVVARVVGRAGGLLNAAGVSVVADATNAPLVDAVWKAATQWLGIITADPLTVSDADLANVTGGRASKFIDAATLEAAYTALGNCDLVDETGELNTQRNDQIRAGINALIDRTEARLRQPYGPSVPAASVSSPVPSMPNDPFDPCRTLPADPRTWPYPR